MNYSIGTCSVQCNALISELYLHRISVFLLHFFCKTKKTYVKLYPLCLTEYQKDINVLCISG